MHLMHAALLALGVLAIALAAEIMFASAAVFWLAGVLATVALLPDADLFSFVMTESVTFSLYSLMTLALVLGMELGAAPLLRASRAHARACSASRGRPSRCWRWSLPVLIARRRALVAADAAEPIGMDRRAGIRARLPASSSVLGSPATTFSVGKFALTEEYGSAALIERFAFDDMTAREFLLAFPYCLPEIGEPRGRLGVRPAGHGAVRLLHAQELLPRRARAIATSWSRRTAGSIR